MDDCGGSNVVDNVDDGLSSSYVVLSSVFEVYNRVDGGFVVSAGSHFPPGETNVCSLVYDYDSTSYSVHILASSASWIIMCE